MDLIILNKQFEKIAVLDKYESLIWTDRYNSYGDFEIYAAASKENLEILQNDYYIISSESEHVMIIDTIKITSNVEFGDHLIITGKSLESLLDRRIVWKSITLDGYLQGQLYKLFDANIMNPEVPERRIPNFVFEYATEGTSIIDNIKINANFTGDNIYDIVKDICKGSNIGFKITLNSQDQFIFTLYAGTDRSYTQNINPYVVFSPSFENIIDNNYYDSRSFYKTTALVAGEGEGEARAKVVVGQEFASGVDRRELYVDARDLSSRMDNDQTMPSDQYLETLRKRGNDRILEYKEEKAFEGQVETTLLYRYGNNFFMGDIVQIENSYGIQSRVRIIEYIYSESTSGYENYPTFEVIEEEVSK